MVIFITYIDRTKYKHYRELLIMTKYYSINEFSKIGGVSAQTLRNWDANGKLHPHHTSGNGHRYYSHEQLNQVMNIKPNLDRLVKELIEEESKTNDKINKSEAVSK